MKPGINMTLGTLVMLVVFGVSAVLLYGGAKLVDSDEVAAVEDGGDGGGVPGGPVNVKVVGQNLLFATRTINASPGAPVTVNFDNQDAGVLHNIAFYTNRSASSPIKVGGIITGIASEEISFTAPSAPGAYFFRCDVHPDTMTGTFNVR